MSRVKKVAYCGRQNSKMDPQDSWTVVAQSNTNLLTAVKRFCRCNQSPKLIDFKRADHPGGPNLII